MGLSKDQIARYSRQLILPEIGVKGQRRLLNSSVLIIGAGGLGSPAAMYLASAGVGKIAILDHESVALSNLHRQILHTSFDIGKPKVTSAETTLKNRNPDISVVPIQERFDSGNAVSLVSGYDLILDGSDNFLTRYALNDSCVISGKPLIHGAAINFQGQLITILPGMSACLRCIFPEMPKEGDIPSCQESGVLGSIVGVIGTLMASEALKFLLRYGELLLNRILIFDGSKSHFREVKVKRDSSCNVCGDTPTIREVRIGNFNCQDKDAAKYITHR